MIRKLILALALLGTVCLMPAGPAAKPAFAFVDCSSTCDAATRRQCQLTGGFCGYNAEYGFCGCIYP
jgi:hypothetical protein